MSLTGWTGGKSCGVSRVDKLSFHPNIRGDIVLYGNCRKWLFYGCPLPAGLDTLLHLLLLFKPPKHTQHTQLLLSGCPLRLPTLTSIHIPTYWAWHHNFHCLLPNPNVFKSSSSKRGQLWIEVTSASRSTLSDANIM